MITDKTPFFLLTILFVLTLASDMTVLYGNDALSILVLSTKKQYSSFLKKVFIFQNISLKVVRSSQAAIPVSIVKKRNSAVFKYLKEKINFRRHIVDFRENQ